jgi:hypothetical protein
MRAGMKKGRPPRDDAMTFLTGGDWSVGLNSPTSLGQAEILSLLGRKLRESYEPVVHEPMPDQLGNLIDRLKQSEGSGSRS